MSAAPSVRAAESHRGGADAEAPELGVSLARLGEAGREGHHGLPGGDAGPRRRRGRAAPRRAHAACRASLDAAAAVKITFGFLLAL